MRPLSQLWLTALRAPTGVAFAHSELALVAHEDIAKLGAVTKPETLNYRTFLPEKNGLFSVEAFGAGEAFLERAQLSSTDPMEHPRATTFGRMNLPVALIHPLLVLHAFDDVAERMHVAAERARVLLASTEDDHRVELAECLARPDMAPILIRSIMVIPPYLRPMVPLGDGRWATSGVNDLYRRVINRANRLARLIELGAPAVININEERMLFEAILSLFANELTDRPVTGPDHEALVSLWGMAGDDRVDALAEHERHAPLTRKRQVQLAAIRGMGFELRSVSTTISPHTTTLGVPL